MSGSTFSASPRPRHGPPVPPGGSNYAAGHRIGRIPARACRGFPGYGTWQHPTDRITDTRGPSFVVGSVPRNTLTGPRRPITPRRATALDAADSGRAISPLVCAGHREPRVDPESGPHRPLHYPGQYRGGSPGRRLTDAHSPTTIRRGRARRGTSGALHPQSATAGLNSRPRSLVSASHSIARR